LWCIIDPISLLDPHASHDGLTASKRPALKQLASSSSADRGVRRWLAGRWVDESLTVFDPGSFVQSARTTHRV